MLPRILCKRQSIYIAPKEFFNRFAVRIEIKNAADTRDNSERLRFLFLLVDFSQHKLINNGKVNNTAEENENVEDNM